LQKKENLPECDQCFLRKEQIAKMLFYCREHQVTLRRGPNGFGFNIIYDDKDPGIYVSFIPPNSPAAKSGELRRGDQILSVNDKDLRAASHDEAAAVLKNCGETANLIVIHKNKG